MTQIWTPYDGIEYELGFLADDTRTTKDHARCTLSLLRENLPHVKFVNCEWEGDDSGIMTKWGRYYIDGDHLEVSPFPSPDPYTTLLRSRLMLDKLVKVWEQAEQKGIMQQGVMVLNNTDPLSQKPYAKKGEVPSWGYHNNHLVKQPPEQYYLPKLMPHLVTRQIYTGSGGLFYPKGRYHVPKKERLNDLLFAISPRALAMDLTLSYQTVHTKGVMTAGRDSHCRGGHRMHLISGDANVLEIPEFLLISTTRFVLNLIDQGVLDKAEHLEKLKFITSQNRSDFEPIIKDMHSISKKTANWTVDSMLDPDMKSAITIQEFYYELSKQHCYDSSDQMNVYAHELWREALDFLKNLRGDGHDDYSQMYGRLGWVSEKYLQDMFAETEEGKDQMRLFGIDMDCARMDQNNLFNNGNQNTLNLGGVIDPEDFKRAQEEPAAGRGEFFDWFIKFANEHTNLKCEVDWHKCIINDRTYNVPEHHNANEEVQREIESDYPLAS